MKKFANVFVASLALILVAPNLASATLVDYTDRSVWETAIGSAPTLTDDFNDAANDVSPVGGVIARTGYGISSVIRIDAAPFLAIGGAGMNCNGSTDVADADNMVITLEAESNTFGADWACGNGSYNWTINYVTDGGDTGSFQLPSSSNIGEFRGFVATNPFTIVTFSSSGCWSAIDNLAAHPGIVSDTQSSWGGVKALYR